jgi:hypothetical protein
MSDPLGIFSVMSSTDLVLELATVDRMAEREFTGFCAALLRARGYRRVRRARRWTRHRVAVDLVARAPDGARVAVRCTSQKDAVSAGAIQALHAAAADNPLAGRAVTLLTNALVTPDARALAAERGITVTDRAGLRHWMEQTRAAGAAPVPRGRRRISRPALIVAGAGSAAALVALAIAMHATATAPVHQSPAPRTAGLAAAGSAAIPGATPAPATPARPHIPKKATFSTKRLPPQPAHVVRAFYAAISSHDWELVWRLGGRNLGYGPYASYQGMVGGYAQTVRDSLTTLRVTGTTVSGSFRAYQADGTVLRYQFSYVVRGGAIVAGHQREV